MTLSIEKIEALAPDQPSLAAARKLLKPAAWPTLAVDGDLVWGECQGSGATPYRVAVHELDAGYKCTCPSRKFPCKHTLALMWMRAEDKVVFTPAPVPEWVKDWLGRRRGPISTATRPDDDATPKTRPSIQLAAAAEAEIEVDPRAEVRAAAARERNRQDREASILRGLDDLDIWLADQVDRGMAAFVAQSTQACRLIAQRLVDSKAPGLATRLEALPTRLFTLPEAVRPGAAVEELGLIYLIAQAYRRQAELPAALAADARQAAGWSFTREALLADAAAPRVTGTWRVVATLSEVQPDRLRRVETWLWRESVSAEEPACAVLMDFVPVATGAASSGYLVGDRIAAELVFYPSAAPLRAQIVSTQGGATAATEILGMPEASLSHAFNAWQAALAQLPWLGVWPLAFRDARLRRTGEALYLTDAASTLALPLQSAQASLALPLAGIGALDGVALWNGYHLTLCWAETPLGRWVAS